MWIAVEFAPDFTDAGDLLADAQAYEAAGAESLLVADAGDGASAVLLGALAVACRRARIGPLEIDKSGWPSEHLDGIVATLDRLSRGRLVLLASAPLSLTERALDGVVVRAAPNALRAGPPPRWVRVEFPRGKAEWKETRAAYEAAGAEALIVPRDPRLLDLLRNPDVIDDRADLNISVG